VLIVKGVNGLGDRLLSLGTAILYARLAGRSLHVDWSDPVYSGDGSNVFPRLFACPGLPTRPEIPETDSVTPAVWKGELKVTAAAMGRRCRGFSGEDWASIDPGRLDYDEHVAVIWTTTNRVELLRRHFSGQFAALRDLSDAGIMGKLLRDDLVLDPEIRHRVERFRGEHFRTPMVGVHVRYSDHRVQLRAILAQTTALTARERGARIFLATDNIEVKRLFDKVYGGVVSTPHWYPPAGLKVHDNAACSDRLENAREALVDLFLLAACDYLVCDSSSSFARVAGHLGVMPSSRIRDMKRKSKIDRRIRKKVWRRWLKLRLFTWGVRTLGVGARLGAALSRVRARRDKVA
jgi:hypothetical protein